MPQSNNEGQILFAAGKGGEGAGRPHLVVAIPMGAWVALRSGDTQVVDLSVIGVDLKIVICGAKSRHATAERLGKVAEAFKLRGQS